MGSQEHGDTGHEQHSCVDSSHESEIVARYLSRGVAEGHEVVDLLAVFLQQQIDTQQEYEECQ